MMVLVVTAVMMAAASGPAIMVAAATAAHMPASMAALHLDYGVLHGGDRGDAESCRGWRCQRKGSNNRRGGKQSNAFHERSSRIA